MIVTLAIFQSGNIQLPNALVAPNSADYTTDIQEAIDKYERKILIDALGMDLYNELVTEYPNIATSAPQNIKDLVNGKDYVIDTITVRWDGLLNKSLLAYYVYYQMVQEKQDIFTTMGVERPEAANSQSYASLERATRAYREFIDQYQGGDSLPNIVSTLNGVGVDYLGANRRLRSLYQYLDDKAADYSTKGDFVLHKQMNSFGV